MPTDIEFDEQDQAEVFDEDNFSLDGAGDASAEFRTFEEIPDVYDVTQAVGDADDDAGLIAEDLDDAEIIDLQSDTDAADIEDDELATRMADQFDEEDTDDDDATDVRLDEESSLDDDDLEELDDDELPEDFDEDVDDEDDEV